MQRKKKIHGNFFASLKKREYTGRLFYKAEDNDVLVKTLITNWQRATDHSTKKEADFFSKIIHYAFVGNKVAICFLHKLITDLERLKQIDPALTVSLVEAYLTLYPRAENLFSWYAEPDPRWYEMNVGLLAPDFDKAISSLEHRAALQSADAISPAIMLVGLYVGEIGERGCISGYFASFMKQAPSLIEKRKLSSKEYLEAIVRYAEKGAYEAIDYLCTAYDKGVSCYNISIDERRALYWHERKKENDKLLRNRCKRYLDSALACCIKYGRLNVVRGGISVGINQLLKSNFALLGLKKEDKPDFIAAFIAQCEQYALEGYIASYLVLARLYTKGDVEWGIPINEALGLKWLFAAMNTPHYPINAEAVSLMYEVIHSNTLISSSEQIELLKDIAKLGSVDAVSQLAQLAIKNNCVAEADHWLAYIDINHANRSRIYYLIAQTLKLFMESNDNQDTDEYTNYYVKWHVNAIPYKPEDQNKESSSEILMKMTSAIGDEALIKECKLICCLLSNLAYPELVQGQVDNFIDNLIVAEYQYRHQQQNDNTLRLWIVHT